MAAILGYVIYRMKFKLNGAFHDDVLRSLAAEREVPTAGGHPL